MNMTDETVGGLGTIHCEFSFLVLVRGTFSVGAVLALDSVEEDRSFSSTSNLSRLCTSES